MKKMKKISKMFILILTMQASLTFANQEILQGFENEAKKEDVKFLKFSIKEGENLFRAERMHSSGEKISCMTCHTSDPKNSGLTRANKVIDPLAPIANKERFTDKAKVEKWFKRNCKDVLERECTIQEKGNFVIYMMSIK